jgi:hypothetical protein
VKGVGDPLRLCLTVLRSDWGPYQDPNPAESRESAVARPSLESSGDAHRYRGNLGPREQVADAGAEMLKLTVRRAPRFGKPYNDLSLAEQRVRVLEGLGGGILPYGKDLQGTQQRLHPRLGDETRRGCGPIGVLETRETQRGAQNQDIKVAGMIAREHERTMLREMFDAADTQAEQTTH